MADLRIFNLDPEVRKAYRLLCMELDTSMNRQTIELIKGFLRKHKKL